MLETLPFTKMAVSTTFFSVNPKPDKLCLHPLQVWNQTTSLSLQSSLWSVALGAPWTSETGFDATHPPSPSSPTAPRLEPPRPSNSLWEDESVHSSNDACVQAQANLGPSHAFLFLADFETKTNKPFMGILKQNIFPTKGRHVRSPC